MTDETRRALLALLLIGVSMQSCSDRPVTPPVEPDSRTSVSLSTFCSGTEPRASIDGIEWSVTGLDLKAVVSGPPWAMQELFRFSLHDRSGGAALSVYRTTNNLAESARLDLSAPTASGMTDEREFRGP